MIGKNHKLIELVSIIIFISLFLTMKIFYSAGLDITEGVTLIIFATLCIFSLQRNIFISLVYLYWFIFFALFIDSITPLSTPDSYKYYVEAFKGGYYRTLGFSDILEGHIPIVEVGGMIIKTISRLMSTENLKVIICFNILLLVESSVLFSNLVRYKFNISKIHSSILFLLLSMSPSVTSVGLELLKDIYVFFGIALSLYLMEKTKETKLYYFLLLSVFVVCTMLRVYFILLLIPYVILFFEYRKKTFRFVVFVSIAYIIFAILFLRSGIVSIVFGSLASLASPNFFRVTNWVNFPFTTLEALLITILFFITVLSSYLNKNYKSFLLISYIFIFSGSVLTGVSQNRLLNDSNYVSTGSLLNDDMSRKKVPFIPLYLTVIFVFSNKKLGRF
ncbi:hypothetical protein AB8613_07420 [Vibrio sp. BS-M-Sm-2]|uniref:hypothetical protein n=1 Tax=Vibrio sp. BS-M-Sm-2 TaxID=3241167 RepID=UPI0035593688